MEKSRLTWREAFTFTRSEKRGFRVLTLLLFLIVCVRVCYFRWSQPVAIEFSVPEEWTFNQSDVISENTDTSFQGSSRRWSSSGQPLHRSWNDSVPQRTYSKPFERSREVELNTADTIELRGLPAIGPWLARKIVEYRERLGGFYYPDQLLEVYRLTPGKLDTIWPYLRIDTTAVRKVDINRIAVEDLLKHPYLSRSQAKGLVAYREKHGPFYSLSDLKKCLLIDDKTFEKMHIYIEVR
jgi:DNA uptake protein ComE-like DNA-binding protein